jgi:hypothetical protein
MATQEVSEENKENLPLWLIEASTPLWESSSQSTTNRRNAARAPLTLSKKDPELAEALSRLSISGRGGPNPRSSTVPNTRPRQRSKLPDHFRFEMHVDPGQATAAAAPTALATFPGSMRRRPRAATFPGGSAAGGYERILYHSTVPGRVPLLPIEVKPVVDGRLVASERRCVSLELPAKQLPGAGADDSR